jgi:CIC family chloride channel protein
MIAAATGALVSSYQCLDETVLLNFRQQQDLDFHKITFMFY